MKRILIGLLLCFVSVFGWSAEIIRYVDPDSAAGGDGTTWALAYDSLFDWEAAEDGNTLDGDWMHVYVRASGGTADTSRCWLLGWTQVDSADYILIEAAAGDEALKTGWDATRYRLEVTDNDCFLVQADYVRFKGLQVRIIYSSVASKICVSINTVGTSDIRVDSCRLRGDMDVSAGSNGLKVNDVDATVTMYNTIVYNHDYRGVLITNAANVYIYNSIIYNCVVFGIDRITSGIVTVKNCAVFVTGNDFNGTITADYCATDDNDQGGNNVAESGGGTYWPNDFEGADTGDFTLLTGSNLKHAGANNPSSGIYTTDMEGNPYNIGADGFAYSLGVDEYVSSAQVTRSGIVIRLLASMWFTEMLRMWLVLLLYSLLGWTIRRLHNGK